MAGEIILPRRKFLGGMLGLLAAPVFVKASALMPVRAFVAEPSEGEVLFIQQGIPNYSQLAQIRDILLPGLRDLVGNYRDIDLQYAKVFSCGL